MATPIRVDSSLLETQSMNSNDALRKIVAYLAALGHVVSEGVGGVPGFSINNLQGESGAVAIIPGSGIVVGNFKAIQAPSADTTFALLDAANITGANLNVTIAPLAKGVTVFGKFTRIQVSAGTCIAYRAD